MCVLTEEYLLVLSSFIIIGEEGRVDGRCSKTRLPRTGQNGVQSCKRLSPECIDVSVSCSRYALLCHATSAQSEAIRLLKFCRFSALFAPFGHDATSWIVHVKECYLTRRVALRCCLPVYSSPCLTLFVFLRLNRQENKGALGVRGRGEAARIDDNKYTL